MKYRLMMMISLSFALLCLSLAPRAQAGLTDQETKLTFSAPVELPGLALPAGTYTFKIANLPSDRNVVLVCDKDNEYLLGIFLTNPDFRYETTDRTEVKFAETPAGSPEALKEWFYPGSMWGHEFIYPKSYGLKSTEITAKVTAQLMN